MPGGVAGVLQPLFSALGSAKEERTAVILDWGGGQSDHRYKAYAATRFGERLAAMGIPAVSAIVTTAAADHMKQAVENLRTSALIAPQIRRVLVLNRHEGRFDFAAGSGVRATFDTLLEAAKDVAIMKVEDVDGESWKGCDEAPLEHRRIHCGRLSKPGIGLDDVDRAGNAPRLGRPQCRNALRICAVAWRLSARAVLLFNGRPSRCCWRTIVNTEGCREVPSAPSSAAYDVDKPWHTVTSDAVRQGGHYYTRHAGRISGATSVGRECLSIGVCG